MNGHARRDQAIAAADEAGAFMDAVAADLYATRHPPTSSQWAAVEMVDSGLTCVHLSTGEPAPTFLVGYVGRRECAACFGLFMALTYPDRPPTRCDLCRTRPEDGVLRRGIAKVGYRCALLHTCDPCWHLLKEGDVDAPTG